MDSKLVLTPKKTVIVVMGASKASNMDPLEWALKHIVRPKDTILVLGILHELLLHREIDDKISCLPFKFLTSINNGISEIWTKRDPKDKLKPNVITTKSHAVPSYVEGVEFEGQGDWNPRKLEEELEERRLQYQSSLQTFYKRCKNNKVKLKVKIAAGFCSKSLTVEEAHSNNACWIVLDSHLKKDKVYIFGHVSCNVAIMKGKEEATLMLSKSTQHDQSFSDYFEDESSTEPLPPDLSPCWYPLSWRSGFPRLFLGDELQNITNGLFYENIVIEMNEIKIYQGLLQETPILIHCFNENDKRFWSILKILSRVRRRNIVNLVGYCCDDASPFLIFDYPCGGTLEMNLQCNAMAGKLVWRTRWCVALEIGASLRYLHEECVEEPIVHHSVSAFDVVFSHGRSAMLSNFTKAKWFKDDVKHTEDFPAESSNIATDERLFDDVYGYGKLLLELITGMSSKYFQEQGDQGSGKTLIEWALPLLLKGLLSQVMDSRLEESSSDIKLVQNMANAAIQCLQVYTNHKFSLSEVLAIVRGNELVEL